MPVTEVGILHLPRDATAPSQEVLEILRAAKPLMESRSGCRFHYCQQVEDPTVIYIIGAWTSPAAHDEFHRSPENQGLLAALQGHIDIDKIVMFHLDVDGGSKGSPSGLPLDAPVVSVNRHFVKRGQRAAFKERFEQVKPLLVEYTKPRAVTGGWRLEKEEGQEWVLFSGLDSVEHHHGFPKTEEFTKYRTIVDFVDRFEVKHMRLLEGA